MKMKRVLSILFVLLILFSTIVSAIDIAEIVLNTSSLTSRESMIRDSLEVWGYNVTIIDTANANYINLSAYNTTVALYQVELDSSLIDSLISNGKGIALIYSAGIATGGTWYHLSSGSSNLIIDNNNAFLEGYGLGTNSYQCDISGYTYYTTTPQPGWTVLGHVDTGQNSVLCREDSGKGAIFGYDPFYYAPHGWNIFRRIIRYVSNETVVTGITIPAGNVGFVIFSYDDITPALLSKEEIVRDSLIAMGYTDITYIGSDKTTVSDYSQAKFVIAVYNYMGLNKPDTLINEGVNVVLIYSAGKACGGTWNSVYNADILFVDSNNAFLEGYGLGTSSYQCSISGNIYYTTTPQPGWTVLGHVDTGQNSVLYKEDNGKGAIFGYDPFYYTLHGNNVFRRIIKYVSNEIVVTGVTVPADNVGFVISSCDDITPTLAIREEIVRDSLVSMGYTDITYIGSDKTTVSDYSQAKFVIAAHNYMGLGKPDTLINEGVNVALIYSACMACGGTWNSTNTLKLFVELNEGFLKNYAMGSTLNMQSAGSEYYTSDELTGWTMIGHTPSFYTRKTALYKEIILGNDTTRGGILSYNPYYYISTGANVFKDLILWVGGEPPVQYPDIFVLPDTLIFSDSGLVSDTVKIMIVYNTGSADLNVADITNSETWVKSIVPSSFDIAPGDSEIVNVAVSSDGLSNGTYYTHLSIASNDPDENPYSEQVRFVIELSGIKKSINVKRQNIEVISIYPNPFSTKMAIDIRLDTKDNNQKTLMGIYDISGHLVRKFKINDPRFTRIVWNGRDKTGETVKTGVYFIKIQTKYGEQVRSKKIIFIK
ncbi:T9SS type A sorting domain-containing protein [candidate division WOR-3 bacterium]|nr:T9SS type A sorting domain-containing protein [candidate division WOR-3 bacterium]